MENHLGKQKPPRKEIAQTLVEFAIVFPVLLLITYGIIEFGRMLFIYTAVTGAAREGARVGASASNYENCAVIRQAVLDKIFLVRDSDVIMEINYFNSTGSQVGACSPGYTGPTLEEPGYRIRVQVTVPFSTIIPFPGIPQAGVNIFRQSTRTLLLGIDIEPP